MGCAPEARARATSAGVKSPSGPTQMAAEHGKRGVARDRPPALFGGKSGEGILEDGSGVLRIGGQGGGGQHQGDVNHVSSAATAINAFSR